MQGNRQGAPARRASIASGTITLAFASVAQNKNSDGFRRSFVLCWRLPIFPGRYQPSIVSASELNCRVRDGNGCTLTAINTNYIQVDTLKTE